MKKYLILMIAVMATMVACDDDPAPSLITSVASFTFIDAPSMIMTTDEVTTTFPVTFKMSSDQVMEVEVEVVVEEGGTATEGVDFTIEPTTIVVPGYLNEGTFNITVIGDALPDGDVESAGITLRANPSQGRPQNSDEAASTFRIDLQIGNYADADEALLICKWDNVLTGTALCSAGDPTPQYPNCDFTDLDPYFLADSGNVFGNYSDDYGACPEEFTGILGWPDDYYIFECENFSNVFGAVGCVDATGDYCINTVALKIGTTLVDVPQRPSECFDITEPGYADAGGAYRVTKMFNMLKIGTTFQFFDPVDETSFGTLRYTISPEHRALMDAKLAAHEGYEYPELTTE